MIKSDTDIRVRRTKKAIYRAFSDLLTEKEFDRITITEIARRAEINKGTFYLHYKDIYDLYNSYLEDSIRKFLDGIDFYELFFDNPSEFLRRFLRYFNLRRRDFPALRPNNRTNLAPIFFANNIREKLYETGRLKKTDEHDAEINFVVYAVIGIFMTQGEEVLNVKQFGSVAAKTVELLFNEYRNGESSEDVQPHSK